MPPSRSPDGHVQLAQLEPIDVDGESRVLLRGRATPASVGVRIEMKDFWLAGVNDPALLQGCSGSLHEAFAATVQRVGRLEAIAAEVAAGVTIGFVEANGGSPYGCAGRRSR